MSERDAGFKRLARADTHSSGTKLHAEKEAWTVFFSVAVGISVPLFTAATLPSVDVARRWCSTRVLKTVHEATLNDRRPRASGQEEQYE